MLQLLQNLIKANSTLNSGEIDSANVLAMYFEANNIPHTIDNWDNSRANCTAHIRSTGQKPALLFTAHLDVVPPGDEKWKFPPFSGDKQEGRILGRGAADMKGGVAAVAAAIAEILQEKTDLQGDIIFTATAGEETDSCGIKRFMKNDAKNLPPLAGIIIPEPTNFEIITAHRGILWLKITTKGKTAHGSTPHHGINAITQMTALLNRLENFQPDHPEHPRLGRSSMSINQIHGGNATNVICDNCAISIDIRTLPDQTQQNIMDQLENIFDEIKQQDEHFSAAVETERSVPAMESDDNSEFIKQFCKITGVKETNAVVYATDASFMTDLNTPIAIYGPGRASQCHKPNEYIEIEAMQKAKQNYKNIIKAYLT